MFRSYNKIIELLVSRPDLNINYTGQRDLSPLMLACIEGNTEGVAIILAREDVDVNIVGKDGVTAISLACLQGNVAIVSMLLQCRGVNINKMTVDGVTPFTVSIFKGKHFNMNWNHANMCLQVTPSSATCCLTDQSSYSTIIHHHP